MCRDRITKEKMTTRRWRQRLEPCTYKQLDMPRITCKHQQQEEVRLDSPLQFSEGAWSCQHLDFRLAASRTVRQVNFCYFKPLNLRDFVTTALGNYYTRLHRPSIFTDSGPGICQNRVPISTQRLLSEIYTHIDLISMPYVCLLSLGYKQELIHL